MRSKKCSNLAWLMIPRGHHVSIQRVSVSFSVSHIISAGKGMCMYWTRHPSNIDYSRVELHCLLAFTQDRRQGSLQGCRPYTRISEEPIVSINGTYKGGIDDTWIYKSEFSSWSTSLCSTLVLDSKRPPSPTPFMKRSSISLFEPLMTAESVPSDITRINQVMQTAHPL